MGGCSELVGGRVGLFSHVTVIGLEGMASSCTREDLGWILGNTTSQRVVRHWNGLPREVVESPSLVVFKERLDVVLRDVV